MKKSKIIVVFLLTAFAVSLSTIAYAWTWEASNWIGGSNGDNTWSFGFGTSIVANGSTVEQTISNTTTVIHKNLYQLNTNLRNGLNALVNNTYKLNSHLSVKPSENAVFSRHFAYLVFQPYVFSLVFALTSRNKGKFFTLRRPPYPAVLRKYASLPL